MADQWEYKKVWVDTRRDTPQDKNGWADLEQLGLQGWEAVGLSPHVGSYDAITHPGTTTFGFYVLLKRRIS